MSQPQLPSGPPSLAQLLAGYLQRQQVAHAAGLAAPDLGGEIVPHEAGPVQPIDARIAWTEALAVLRLFGTVPSPQDLQPPPDWPSLVNGQEPIAALALSLGNFPQQVRDLHALLRAERLRELRPTNHPVSAVGLLTWADKVAAKPAYPQLLMAIAVLRLARLFNRAAEIMSIQETSVPAPWRVLWENEKAALAWHRGDERQARQLWLAQPDSGPVLFNRGMAALFLDQPAEARSALGQAASRIPETSAWHHLARLYLALAEMRV